MTDRMLDFLASLGTSPGDAGLSSPVNVLPPMSLFDGDGGVTDDGLSAALLGLDVDSAGMVATISDLGAQVDGALATASADDDAGVFGELSDLLSEEPLFAFDGPHLSQTGGLATHFASAYSHAAFDPAEAIRQSLWYDDAAPVEAAGQAPPWAP